MTISMKKISTSSKLTTVYLSCPPLCGLFSIQQNTKDGLSYKVKITSPDTNLVRSYNHAFCLGTNSILRAIPIPSANLLSKLTEGFLVPFSSLLISA